MSKSYNTVCPSPETCDAPRALMSVTPNLCCDETEPRSIHSPDRFISQFFPVFSFSSQIIKSNTLGLSTQEENLLHVTNANFSNKSVEVTFSRNVLFQLLKVKHYQNVIFQNVTDEKHMSKVTHLFNFISYN